MRTQQPGKDIQVWFMDEARIGQKGRNGHRWWPKGERAPGLADKRFVSTYLYTAVRPTTDDAFALVLPEVNANTMASCCSIKPDGTARRRSRCRWAEPSTASKACIFFLFFRSCPGPTGVVE